MVDVLQRAKRVGGSIMVRIPKDAALLERINNGDLLKLTITKARRDVFGTLPAVGRFTREDKLDADD